MSDGMERVHCLVECALQTLWSSGSGVPASSNAHSACCSTCATLALGAVRDALMLLALQHACA